jgi:PAS domain-containing protein
MEAGEKPRDLANAGIASAAELRNTLVDASPLAMFAIDLQGAVTYCNPAAEILTGWTRNELVGHQLPFDPGGTIQGKNGRPIECAVWTAPLRTLHGPPRGKVIIAAGGTVLRDAGLKWSSTSATPAIALRR